MARDRAFPALRAALTSTIRRGDPRARQTIKEALGRAEHLAERRLATIKRLLVKLRACRVEGRERAREQRRLAALLAEAREVIRESGEVQEANAAILDAERNRRLAAEAALADAQRITTEAVAHHKAATTLLAVERARRASAEALLLRVLDDGALDVTAPDAIRDRVRSAIRAFLGLGTPGANGPVGGILAKLGK